jgi:membrane-associated phospholipid phosphatase
VSHQTRQRAFGVSLGLGIFVLVAAGWLFGAIAEDVVNRDAPLGTLDLDVAAWLHAHATPAMTSLMFILSDLGAPVSVIAITLLTAAVLATRRRWYRLVFLLLATVGGEVVNFLMKKAVHRQRPFFEDPIVTLTSFSFPSGHAMGSTVLYGALAAIMIWPMRQFRWRVATVCAAALLVALICFSRIYLGVHYLSDVVAGCLAGLVWLVSCLMAVDALRHRQLRAN